jgi:hypothetical protein
VLILNYTPQELQDFEAAAQKEEHEAKKKKFEDEKAKKAQEEAAQKSKDELSLDKLLAEVENMKLEEDKLFKEKTAEEKAQDEEHKKVLAMVAQSQKETEAVKRIITHEIIDPGKT